MSIRYLTSKSISFGFVCKTASLLFQKKMKQPDRSQHCGCYIFIMIQYTCYKQNREVSTETENKITAFLFTHLEQYGDPKSDIQKCMDYTLCRNGKPGGLLLTAEDRGTMVGAVVINFTGMEDYIPENILVYIATHNAYRGQGIGKRLMHMAIEHTQGNIALHVEPDNPARKLYEKLGFTNKYLEMRLNK